MMDSVANYAYYKPMSVYKRQDIPKLLDAIKQGVTSQIYLLFGERYLCRNAAHELIDHLLPDKQQQATSLINIDGDKEDSLKTLNQLKTYSLFSGRKIYWVTDSRLFYSKGVTKDIWEKVCEKKAADETPAVRRYLLQMLSLAGISPSELSEENVASLSASRWKSLFGFAKPEDDLAWIQDILTDMPDDAAAAKGQGNDAASMYALAFEAGIPGDNILILLAEAVDKRKRLYKYIQEHGIILDLSVDPGNSAAARRDQEKVLKDLLLSTLKKYAKEIESQSIPVFLDRVGFHPVAVVMEAEKLALYVGDRKTITREDIDEIIGRTREEALFELTEAVTAGRLEDALLILDHLQSGGVHGLAILATLKNYLEKMLLVRALQDLSSPAYAKSLSFPAFQKTYLPQLKDGRDEWTTLLWKNHPYALYMLFRQAAQFCCEELQDGLKKVLTAEYRMKGSPVDGRLILDNLLFNLLRQKMPEAHTA